MTSFQIKMPIGYKVFFLRNGDIVIIYEIKQNAYEIFSYHVKIYLYIFMGIFI